MKYLFILLASLVPSSAWACEVPPNVQHVSDMQLIQRTNNIVLAKATDIKIEKNKWIATYVFQTLESIKGNLAASFNLSGFVVSNDGEDSDFNNHTAEPFWQRINGRSSGRSYNHPDCLIHPNFSLNGIYLIFYDAPYHSKSFEKIVNKNKDEWLTYVRAAVAP